MPTPYEPHVAPPTQVSGSPAMLREGVVQTVNPGVLTFAPDGSGLRFAADGLRWPSAVVDLKALDSRAGWTNMSVPGWYTPAVDDHVIVADLQGDAQKATVLAPVSGVPLATQAAVEALTSAVAALATTPAATSANVGMTGEVRMWSGTSAPDGWQKCDGSDAATTALDAFLKAQAPASPYGVNGVTGKAKVPDLGGRSPLGVGTATGAAGATAHTLGQAAGEETHQLSITNMPSHSHPPLGPTSSFIGGGSGGSDFVSGLNWQQAATTGNTGGGGSHNNMPPYVGLNFIIKT
jgi:microcystin-dependent protein